MENFGYRTGAGPPAFTAGRRRKFDEFALGEEVQADRVHRPLHAQIPGPLEGPWSRVVVPYESRLHINHHSQVGLQPPKSQKSLTWSQVLARTFAVGTVVVAVMSMQLFRTVLRQTSRAGRHVYMNRDHVRHTCTAVLQSSCNVAKRRLVTISGHLPALTSHRRRLVSSSSSSSSSSSQRRSPGHSYHDGITNTHIPSEQSLHGLLDHAPGCRNSAADVSDGDESDGSYVTAPEIPSHESLLTVDGTDKSRGSRIPNNGSSASRFAQSRKHNATAQASSASNEHSSSLPGLELSSARRDRRRRAKSATTSGDAAIQTPRRRSARVAEKLLNGKNCS